MSQRKLKSEPPADAAVNSSESESSIAQTMKEISKQIADDDILLKELAKRVQEEDQIQSGVIEHPGKTSAVD